MQLPKWECIGSHPLHSPPFLRVCFTPKHIICLMGPYISHLFANPMLGLQHWFCSIYNGRSKLRFQSWWGHHLRYIFHWLTFSMFCRSINKPQICLSNSLDAKSLPYYLYDLGGLRRFHWFLCFFLACLDNNNA
jgi:hypothetical protein